MDFLCWKWSPEHQYIVWPCLDALRPINHSLYCSVFQLASTGKLVFENFEGFLKWIRSYIINKLPHFSLFLLLSKSLRTETYDSIDTTKWTIDRRLPTINYCISITLQNIALLEVGRGLLFRAPFCIIIIIIIRKFCPRAGLLLQTQASRLQFCPKAGLPPQTQEPRLQFY